MNRKVVVQKLCHNSGAEREKRERERVDRLGECRLDQMYKYMDMQ